MEFSLLDSDFADLSNDFIPDLRIDTWAEPAEVELMKADAGSLRVASEGIKVEVTRDISADLTPVDPSPFADTVPGDVSSAATIALGGSVDVTIDTLGDHDWFRVSLVAGQTYTIQTSSDGSGTDAFLNLRDATGALLASDDDAGDGVNSLISFTATSTGTYFIDAGTYNNETIGSYHLFVAPAFPGGDVGGTTATAASLAIGGTVNGSLEVSGDHDFYSINLVAGQTYIFRTAPTSTPTNTVDTILTLRNAAGTQLLTNDDAGEFAFSAIRYTATSSGMFYLDVSGFGTATGAFNLSAFTAPTPVVFTNDQIANQLTNGYWGGASHHFNVAPGGSLTFNVQGLTVDGANLARAALALWSDVTGIVFNEVAVGGQLVYDDNQTGAFASSSYSGGIISSSTINVGTAWVATYGTGLNTYSFQTYIHETGHALGLGHAGNYNGSADYSSDSLYLNDSWATTIMSYFDQTENTYFQGLGFTRQFVETPMMADIIATTALYGTNTLTRTGDTTYGFGNNSGRDIYDATLYPSIGYTIYDNGGRDLLDYSGFSQNQRIDLNAESFSDVGGRVGNVSIARGSVIEWAYGGSGNDTLIGNSADNRLRGNAGIDRLYGGAGNDTLLIDASDAIVDGGTGTADRVIFMASGTYGVTSNGSELGVAFSGNEIADLAGFAVTLTAFQFTTGFGATPELGNGALTINMAPTTLELYLTTATVTPGFSFSVTINGSASDEIIKGILGASNTINGGDGADQIRGGAFADVINGGNGDDKLFGANGADIMTGGAGADQFRFQTAASSGLGAAADQITDFTIGTDILSFRGIDTDAVTPGDQGFAFIGTAGFGATGAAQIRYLNSGANLLVQADINGDGIADMEVVLQGLTGQTLTGASFLL